MNEQFGADLIFVDEFNWNDNGKDLTEPVLQYVKDSFVRDNYLDKDKVREAFREMLDGGCCGEPDCICNGYVVRLWASKLFPEGVEK